MKGAVVKSYEQSRATVRVSAVQSGKFTIVLKPTAMVLGSGKEEETIQYGVHVVTYSKGLEGRGMYEEDVDIISLDALKAVITAVHSDHHEDDTADSGGNSSGREMLRPISMAQLSP
eukprot:8778457-Ditylum_brightwellii.AAC.1